LLPEKRNPTEEGGVRFYEGDLLGGDRHQDSETPDHLQVQARRIARLFFVAPETAAVIAGLAFSGCPR
jgi:hypothetical protein